MRYVASRDSGVPAMKSRVASSQLSLLAPWTFVSQTLHSHSMIAADSCLRGLVELMIGVFAGGRRTGDLQDVAARWNGGSEGRMERIESGMGAVVGEVEDEEGSAGSAEVTVTGGKAWRRVRWWWWWCGRNGK